MPPTTQPLSSSSPSVAEACRGSTRPAPSRRLAGPRAQPPQRRPRASAPQPGGPPGSPSPPAVAAGAFEASRAGRSRRGRGGAAAPTRGSGKAAPLDRLSAWPVTQTGVWSLERE